MSLLLLGALVGVVITIVAVIAALWPFKVNLRRQSPQPFVPQFIAERDAPRTITRIRKEHIDWEIN